MPIRHGLFLCALWLISQSVCATFSVTEFKLTNTPPLPTDLAQYDKLSANLGDLSHGTIKSYLTQNSGSPTARKLREQWMRQLAQKGQWQTLIDNFAPTSDRAQNCLFATALYNKDRLNYAQKIAQKLWLSASSQPAECNNLFRVFINKNYITQQDIWARLRLALAAEQFQLATYIAELLPNPNRNYAQDWIKIYRNPELLLTSKIPQSDISQDIIADGLARLSDRKPKKVMELWELIKDKQHFSRAQLDKVNRAVALQLALMRNPASIEWFRKLSYDPNDLTVNEWRARSALMNRYWSELKYAIDLMPRQLRQSDSWQYWYARALKEMGKREEAFTILQNIARNRSYYGFLACRLLGQRYSFNEETKTLDPSEVSMLSSTPLIQQSKFFYYKKDRHNARNYWIAATKDLDEHKKYIAAKIAQSWGWYDQAIFTAKDAEFKDDLALRFPVLYQKHVARCARAEQVHDAFIYAIIRQESSFNPQAQSVDGALGMMQLMPGTARQYRHKVGRGDIIGTDLSNIHDNITVGTSHLRRMLNQFRGHYVLVAAAYNAGQGNVSKWLPKQGVEEASIWIETLPWYETRDYIKNVLTYFVIYQYRLGRNPDITQVMQEVIPSK